MSTLQVASGWLARFLLRLNRCIHPAQALTRWSLPWWQALLIPAGVLTAIESTRRLGIVLPVPYLLLVVSLVWVATLSTVRTGLAAAGLAAAYLPYAASVGFGPHTLIGAPWRVGLGILFLLALTGYIGLLRRHSLQALTAAQVDLEHQTLRYQILVDHLGEALFLFDRTGIVRYRNRNAEQMLGDSLKVGDCLFEGIHGHDRASVESQWRALLREDTGGQRLFRYRAPGADGHWHTWEGLAVNLLERPEFRGILFSARDVTETTGQICLFQELWKAIPDGLLLVDTPQGAIRQVNPALCALMGYTPGELIGRPYSILMPPESQENGRALHRSLQPGDPDHATEPTEVDTSALRRDGTLLPVEIRLTPVELPGGPYALALLRDVQEERQIKQALAAHAHFLETLQRMTQIGLELLDPERLPQIFVDELRELLQADACYLTRWEPDRRCTRPLAASGPHRDSYLDLDPPPGAETLTARVLATGQPLVVEDVAASPAISEQARGLFPREQALLALPVQAGERIPLGALILAYHAPRRFSPQEVERAQQAAAQVALILHRAQLHHRLQQRAEDLAATVQRQERILQDFFELTPTPMLVAQVDGVILQCNQALAQLTDSRPEALVGRPWPAFLHPEDRDRFAEVAQGLGPRGRATEVRLRGQTPRGVEHSLSCSMTRYGDRLYIVAQDITAQEETAARLVAAREQAEAASQAKSDFLAMISHELRTPLNAILGFTELLDRQLQGQMNERQRRYLTNIYNSGRHLTELINDLLDLSRIEAGRLELHLRPVRLDQVVRQASEGLATLIAQKEHALELALDGPTPTILADPERTRQILVNLLSNAVKYTPPQGRIRIGLEACSHRAAVHLWIADTGIGLAPEDQERIFRLFEQVDSPYTRNQEGTGLGLALTRQLVELHGGRIWVESPGPDQGSTFHVELPIVPAARLEQIDIQARTSLVLVVEDDLNDGDLIAHHLEEAGYGVLRAYRAVQAVELAQEYVPDLIVLDILMKPEDGWHVLHAMETIPVVRWIPVVVISITEDAQRGRRYGVMHWLVKPVTSEALLQAVAEALARGRPRGKVLVVGVGPGEAPDAAGQALERRHYLVEWVSAPQDALYRALTLRPDAVLLTEEVAEDPELVALVARQLRVHPLTSQVSLLVPSEPPASPQGQDMYPEGLRALLRALADEGFHFTPYGILS